MTKVTSHTAAGEIVRAASRQIVPPAHVPLANEDQPFWVSVIGEFARSEWTDHQLELAAMLARTMADLEREQAALRLEGSVLTNERGTPVVNPRKTVIQMHAATILSFRRSLALHARAQGEARDVGKRRMITKDVEAQAETDDDLLPRVYAVK